MKENRILFADSYKFSQPMQYKSTAEFMYGYMEARGGVYPATVFFGLQAMLLKYFSDPITEDEVNEAKMYVTAHGEPFDYDGWMYIAKELKGKIPVKIKAVPEGSLIPVSHPLVTIESTDQRVFWIKGWFETFLMTVWYPTTVASKSYYVKYMLKELFSKYSDTDFVDFSFHNFGARGSTNVEAAAIGGMAHLTQFQGTDNVNALRYARFFYNADIAGYSIPASEHSTVTSWSRDNEFDMIDTYIETFKSSPIIACVLDSYDIYKAVDRVTSGQFKDKIESSDYPIFVMRPDSGEPIEVIIKMLGIIEKNNVQYTTNSKNLKVMNKYRIIYGDGITPEVIKSIIEVAVRLGFAPDNFAFGSGGDLMQNINRDTSKFAIKCSYMEFSDGTSIEVFKDPITDPGKTSKKGKVTTYFNKNTKEFFVDKVNKEFDGAIDILETVYKNGEMIKTYSFAEVRENINAYK